MQDSLVKSIHKFRIDQVYVNFNVSNMIEVKNSFKRKYSEK